MHLAKHFVRQGYLARALDPAVSRIQPLRLRLPFLSISLDLAQPALRGASVAIQICNRLPFVTLITRFVLSAENPVPQLCTILAIFGIP